MVESLLPEDLPEGLTESAKQAKSEFLARYRKRIRARRKIALNLLVWGQDPTNVTALSKKRIQIRDELIRLGHNAMFSEEMPIDTATSVKTSEHAQLEAADAAVVLLEDSPGALGETHDFYFDPELARKMFILAPLRYADGYSGQGALREANTAFGTVHWYEDHDLQTCNVLKEIVVRVETLRELRYRALRAVG